MRRHVAIASAGVAVFVAAPMFYWLGSIALRKRPVFAEHVTGVWYGSTPDGDEVRLRFNNRGVATYDSPTSSCRGPVTYAEDGASIFIEPILLFLGGDAVQCRISQWPKSSAEGETIVANGIELRKNSAASA